MSERISLSPGLREAADLLEQHPTLPEPYIISQSRGRVQLNWYLNIEPGFSLDDQKSAAAGIVRAIGGAWDKSEANYDELLNYDRQHGLLKLHVQVDRPAVCERVVVGTKPVTIPAVEAQPERTVQQDVVEWRCQPLLADGPATAEAVA